MQIFKTKIFRKFQRKAKVNNKALCDAIGRAEDGLIDADLGRGLIKQRIPLSGQGKSGGTRSIIAYRSGTRAVFIFGFAKSKQENITAADERDMADTGAMLLGLDVKAIAAMVLDEELFEVICDAKS